MYNVLIIKYLLSVKSILLFRPNMRFIFYKYPTNLLIVNILRFLRKITIDPKTSKVE